MALTEAQKNTLGSLSTLTAVLDKIDIDNHTTDVDFYSNFTNGGTPFGFLVNLFQVLGSYQDMIDWLTKLLVNALPALEIAIKGVLLTNIKAMGACNADPRIPDKYRKDYNPTNPFTLYKDISLTSDKTQKGVKINVGAIDYGHMLKVSPITDEGTNYYFGQYVDRETGAHDIVEKKWDNYTIKEKAAYIKSGGKEKAMQGINVTKRHFHGVYELCRADDFNAFLWFVIHKGYFASPLVYETKVGNTTALQALMSCNKNCLKLDKNDEYSEYEQAGGTTGLPLYTILPYLECYGTNNYLPGATFVERMRISDKNFLYGKLLHLCVNGGYAVADKKTNKLKTTRWVPISSDWNSVNWYVNPDNYYKYNIGKKGSKSLRDYNREMPICNLEYLNTSYGVENSEDDTIRVTILPKPYFVGGYLTYILFNEEGQQDKKGHFSLPTGFLSDGVTLYVRRHYSDAVCVDINTEGMKNILYECMNYDIDEITSHKSELKNKIATICSSYDGVVSATDAFRWITDKKEEIESAIDSLVNSQEAIEQKHWDECNSTFLGTKDVVIECLKLGVESIKSLTKKLWNEKYTKNELSGVIKNLFDKYMMAYAKVVEESYKACGEMFQDTEDEIRMKQNWVRYYVGPASANCMLYFHKSDKKYYLADAGLTDDDEIMSAKANPDKYTVHLQECYKGLTVYEFNYDMVMGMKLFDPKIVATALVNALFNINVGLGVSFPTSDSSDESNEVQELINAVLSENEDKETVSDCYYTFSNDTYSSMMQKSELAYLKKKTLNNGASTSVSNVNATELNSILKEYDENGTKHEQSETLSKFFRTATIQASDSDSGSTDSGTTDTDKNQIQVRFAVNMLGAIAGVLVEAILTPKLMFIYEVNKAIMGGDVSKDLTFKDVFNSLKNVIYAVIKEIRDIIIKELLDYLLELLKPLLKRYSKALVEEQIKVYKDLITYLTETCIPQLKSQFGSDAETLLDTALNDGGVSYADIASNGTNSTGEIVNSNC